MISIHISRINFWWLNCKIHLDTFIITNMPCYKTWHLLCLKTVTECTSCTKNKIFAAFSPSFYDPRSFVKLHQSFSFWFYSDVFIGIYLIVAFNKIVIVHWCVPSTFYGNVINSLWVYFKYLTWSVLYNH